MTRIVHFRTFRYVFASRRSKGLSWTGKPVSPVRLPKRTAVRRCRMVVV